MSFALMVLLVVLSVLAASADPQKPGSLPFNPFNQFYNSPHGGYPAYYEAHQPAVDPNARLFWGVATTTTTTTTTSTSTATCTISTSSVCTGRRRRGIEWSEETDEAIAPSSVAKVVSTPAADMDTIRQSREANPQYYYQNPFGQSFMPHYNYAVQPTFGLPQQSIFNNNYQDISYYGGSYNPQNNNPARWFGWWNRVTVTSTSTSTVFTVSTSSSTPTCSTTGSIAQCPNSG